MNHGRSKSREWLRKEFYGWIKNEESSHGEFWWILRWTCRIHNCLRVYACVYVCVCESNLILLQSFKSFFQRVARFGIKFRVFLRNKMHLNTSRHRNVIHEGCFEHVFCGVALLSVWHCLGKICNSLLKIGIRFWYSIRARISPSINYRNIYRKIYRYRMR